MMGCFVFFVTLINLLLCRESYGAPPSDVDLEKTAQDYVLEVKQLHIPGHPTACNASIVR